MRSHITLATISLLSSTLVSAINTGFVMAKSKACESNQGCLSGIAISGANYLTCDAFGNRQIVYWEENNNRFHVQHQPNRAGEDPNNPSTFCGVVRMDMYRECDDCANYDVYLAGGEGGKIGYCYPVNGGAMQLRCPLPHSGGLTTYDEYMYCALWGDEVTQDCAY